MIDSKSCDNESDLMAHRHYLISKSLVDRCRIVITTVIAGGLTSNIRNYFRLISYMRNSTHLKLRFVNEIRKFSEATLLYP
jgi:hypothetical protein